jgi:hypothetical protein
MAPYSPKQNGVAKRMNRTIQEQIVSMLHHSGLLEGFWAEALLTAVHIINMSPSRPVGPKIPQELWTRRKPNYGKLRIFGCEAYALVPRNERRQLESRSRKCIFLGYGPNRSFGYRLWDPESHQVVRSLDMVFNESMMHKFADRSIELRRVMFSDITTPLDGPAQHTSRPHGLSILSKQMEPYLMIIRVAVHATICPTGSDELSSQVRSTIAPEPVNPVVPRRSERLS